MPKYIYKMALIAMAIFWGCHFLNESERDSHKQIANGSEEQIRQKGNEFAIYLPAKRITPEQMSETELSELELNKSSILSIDDIFSYTKESHQIEVTASAYKRINQIDVGVYGTVFFVCVGQNPIYWGAFWTPISSIPSDGVVILLNSAISADKYVIQIQLGYPTDKYFSGEDPRTNQEILQSLERAGKLK
jgi:hypothetical protein